MAPGSLRSPSQLAAPSPLNRNSAKTQTSVRGQPGELRILQMRCAHALYPVDETHSATLKLNCRPPLLSDSPIVQTILAAPCHHLLPVNASLHVPRRRRPSTSNPACRGSR